MADKVPLRRSHHPSSSLKMRAFDFPFRADHANFSSLSRPGMLTGATEIWTLYFLSLKTLAVPRTPDKEPPLWFEGGAPEIAMLISNVKTLKEIDAVGGTSVRAVEMAFKDLRERGFVEKDENSRKPRYRLLPDNWLTAEPYSAPIPRVAKPKPEEAREETPEATPPEYATLAAAPVVARSQLVVMPGQFAKPIPINQAVKNVLYRNTGSTLCQHRLRIFDGIMLIDTTLEKDEQKAKTGEELAKPTSLELGSIAENKRVSKKEERRNRDELRDYLERRFLPQIREPLHPPILAQIRRNLGAATVEEFSRNCDKQANDARKWVRFYSVAKDTAEVAKTLAKQAQRGDPEYERFRRAHQEDGGSHGTMWWSDRLRIPENRALEFLQRYQREKEQTAQEGS